MRIIRSAVALSMLCMVTVPQVASTVEAFEAGSNETNINFKIEDNFILENGVIRDKNTMLLASTPKNFEGYISVKTEDEIKREKVLAKYEEKRKNASYPQGKFTINASAYTAAADECGKSDGITASGLKVKEGVTIACPPQFPFGTKIKIEGMGTRICEDRGGAIKGNHIDIYMETKKDAFSFGRKNLEAEVIM
ncbi:MAG TPA: 3D domain-containing protein [Candidatus Moranbacteria bacterium]|nr:3D domain-containing protein [Candidatus Moranbacteria bacterium]